MTANTGKMRPATSIPASKVEQASFDMDSDNVHGESDSAGFATPSQSVAAPILLTRFIERPHERRDLNSEPCNHKL